MCYKVILFFTVSIHSINPLAAAKSRGSKDMAIRDEFLAGMLGEGVEQAIHEMLTADLKASADRGASGKEVAKSGLKSLFGSGGRVMRLARGKTGFTWSLLGIAISQVLAKSGFIDLILPGDNRPAIKEAKWLLKHIGPHAVLGAFSAYRDVATHIDSSVDEARSDAHIAPAAANRPFDMVAAYDDGKDKGAVPLVRDAAGNPELSPDGTPVGNSAAYRQFVDRWNRQEFDRVQNSPRGQGRAAPTPRPAPVRILPIDQAISQGYLDTATPAELAPLMKMLQKPGSRGEQMSDEVKDLFAAMSITSSTLPYDEQMEAESLISDVVAAGDIALIEHAANRFGKPTRPDGGLPLARFRAVLTHFDNVLGGKLNIWEKGVRAAFRAWRNRGQLSPAVRAFARDAGRAALIFAISQVVIFMIALCCMLLGYTVMAPSLTTAICVVVGAYTMMMMFRWLGFVQAVLNVIGKRLGASEDWLVGAGQRVSVALIPIIVVGLARVPGVDVSGWTRLLIIGIMAINTGRHNGYLAAKYPALAQLLLYFGTKWGYLLTAIVVGIDWAVRQGFHAVAGSVIAEGTTTVWDAFNNQWGAMFVLFVVVFGLFWAILRRLHQRIDIAPNGARFVRATEPHGWMTFLAFLLAAGIALTIPFMTKAHVEFDPLGAKESAAAEAP